MRIEAGSIQEIPANGVLPEDLHFLGQQALGRVAELKEAGELTASDPYRVDMSDLSLEGRAVEVLEQLYQAQRELLKNNPVDFQYVQSWLIFGLLANIDWHADTPGDFRFMNNVGEDTSVNVAEEWDPRHYPPGEPNSTVPPVSREILLPRGASYVGNNLVTDLNLLRPHQTPVQKRRLVIRSSWYAESDWTAKAGDGGVDVVLNDDAFA